eukprot:TRINITY_DN11049_c0_g1_i1.p2 TRINITY_DN11049_c0_g1~~TRINITY_DN11049_c0_g1_i1.p2  ORF type:complete len:211 (+),score=50.35 TRINITY_DN11049_c0_g1_i1:38-634(+)
MANQGGNVVGTLYHTPGSHSRRILWLVLEMNLSMNVKTVDSEETRAGFKRLFPAAKTPLLVLEGGVTISECCAIVLYILDTYDNGKLGGKPGTVLRAHLYKWSSTCTAVDEFFQPGPADAKVLEIMKKRWSKTFQALFMNGLGCGKYFVGNEFSGVDILVGYSLYNIYQFIPEEDMGPLKNYVEFISSKPHFKTTMIK